MAHKKKLTKFFSIIRDNETIQQEFFEIEKIILRIHTFHDLISTLLKVMKNQFALHHVGITFLKGKYAEEFGLEDFCKRSGKLCNFLDRSFLYKSFIKDSKPKLENKNIEKWADFFPKKILQTTGSVSVIPLKIDKKVIGTLNLSDSSTKRYDPARDTQFLERLAIIVSISIDNVIHHERLKHISITDPLTGLVNRRHLYTVIEKEIRRSFRYGDPFSILYIDLNDFKHINDSCGHNIGDKFLQHVSDILLQEARDSDCVSRFGGDEFVIALCRSNRDQAKAIIERIQKKFDDKPFRNGNKKLPISASFGLSSTERTKGLTADKLLRNADRELYREKKKNLQKKNKP